MHHIEIIFLALIQGLTEFLPISSSGHLALAPKLFGFKDPGLDLDAFLHLGTLLAVLIYFRAEVLAMLKSFISNDPANRKLSIGIIIATIPAMALGFSFKSFFESDLARSPESIIITLGLGSILMFMADRFSSSTYLKKEAEACEARNASKNITDLSYKEMLFIGAMQALALFPGFSRSGATISAGLFIKLNREEAARFSFIVGLPAVGGAGLIAVKDLISDIGLSNIDWSMMGTGFLVSFVSGYLAIDFMIKFLKTQSLNLFIIYRILLMIVVYLVLIR